MVTSRVWALLLSVQRAIASGNIMIVNMQKKFSLIVTGTLVPSWSRAVSTLSVTHVFAIIYRVIKRSC